MFCALLPAAAQVSSGSQFGGVGGGFPAVACVDGGGGVPCALVLGHGFDGGAECRGQGERPNQNGIQLSIYTHLGLTPRG